MQAFGIVNQDKMSRQEGDTKSRVVHAGKWMFNHDARQYAKENYGQARNHLVKGTSFRNTNIPPGLKYRPWTIDGLLEAQANGEPTVLDGDWS